MASHLVELNMDFIITWHGGDDQEAIHNAAEFIRGIFNNMEDDQFLDEPDRPVVLGARFNSGTAQEMPF